MFAANSRSHYGRLLAAEAPISSGREVVRWNCPRGAVREQNLSEMERLCLAADQTAANAAVAST